MILFKLNTGHRTKPSRLDVVRQAHFSRCKQYRYHLSRRGTMVNNAFCRTEPSTADTEIDDATTRKCMLLAKSWGFSGFELVNLFALKMRSQRSQVRGRPSRRYNDRWLKQTLHQEKLIVACWGNGGTLFQREQIIWGMHIRLHCLGTTKSGQPKHPLYLPLSTPLRALCSRNSSTIGRRRQEQRWR